MIKDNLEIMLQCILSRKEVVIIYSWTAMIGLAIAYRGFPPLLLALQLFLSMSSIGYGVYFFNDICDFDEDLRSRELGNSTPSNRPLGTGKVSKRQLMSFTAFFVILGLAVSLLINLQVFLLQSLFLVLGYIYSTTPLRIKKRFLLKQLTISIGGAIACLLGGLAVGELSNYVLFFTGMSFIQIFTVNPIIDLRDIEGDREVGINTIPVKFGPKFTVRLAVVVLLASIPAAIMGFYNLGFNVALPILGAIVFTATVIVIYPLMDRWQDAAFINKTITRRMYPLFLMIQMVFLLGSLPL